MSKIIAIKHVTTKAGKPNVLVTTAERDHWVSLGQWTNKAGKANIQNFVGGDFDANYFQVGDILLNGSACTESDIILDDFTVSMNEEVLARAEAVRAEKEMQDQQHLKGESK